jgi:hypothetical protein
MPELAVCAAGSLLGVNLTGESFPVGNVTFLDLYPMSFVEFLEGIGKERLIDLLDNHDFSGPLPEMAHGQLWEMWKHYLIVGGLPEAVKTYRDMRSSLYEAMQAVRAIQRDLLETNMADIAKHSGKTNALHIERVWRTTTYQLARTQDGSAPKFKFKDVIPGIRGYDRLASPLDWLESARLVIRNSIVEKAESPLTAYTRENRFKQYFFDVGLRGAVSGLEPSQILQYEYGSYKGYVAENYVAQEIRASGVRALFCWEGRTSEIEFLLETESGIIPIEVKSGQITQSNRLNIFEGRYKPKMSIVLNAKNIGSQGTRYYLPLYLAGCLMEKFPYDI